MSTITLQTSLYCTDEDLAIACPGDFAVLAPVAQTLCKASDGVFAATTGGSWVLTSASINFQTLGVAQSHVLQISGPQTTYPTTDLLAVDSVSANTVTLRRPGLPLNMGYPPGPAAGATGVLFKVVTLYPQIERASYDLRKQFDLDDTVPGRSYSDMYDPRELQEACISLVLSRQYRDMARHSGKMEDFQVKSQQHKADFDRIVQRTILHMNNNHPGGQKLDHMPRITR